MKTCTSIDCELKVAAKDLCWKHYNSFLYHKNKNNPFTKLNKSLASKRYYEKNKAHVLELQKIRREANPELLRARVRESQRKLRKKYRERGINVDDKYLFGGNKQLIYDRDNNSCQDCGLNQQGSLEQFGQMLGIHHIDGKGYGTKKKKEKNNNPPNLVTLCSIDHTKEHSRIRAGKTP